MKQPAPKSPKQQSSSKPPAGKIVVPAREKLGELTNAQLVALRDSLHGRKDVDKAYKRAVRVHERATRGGKVAKKPAAKKPAAKKATPKEELRKAA